MRHAARVDVNQAEICAALRAAGAYVWIIGLPVDLLVGYTRNGLATTVLMEVKRNGKAKFTPLQENFFKNWLGAAVCRVDSPESALKAIGLG